MIHFDSGAPVRLKGVGDGFWITLDPSRPEDVLIAEIDQLFKKLSHLAINASVVLDVGAAGGHDDLVERIRSHIMAAFEVARVSRPPEKRSVPLERIRQRDLSRGWSHHRSDVLVLRGIIRSGQKIESNRRVIIMGDVNPGAEIVSLRDIFILGKLAGKVHAGSPQDDSAIVFALEFRPTLVRIGTATASGVYEEAGLKPEFACVENGLVMVKEYMKHHPFRRMPWPEAL